MGGIKTKVNGKTLKWAEDLHWSIEKDFRLPKKHTYSLSNYKGENRKMSLNQALTSLDLRR